MCSSVLSKDCRAMCTDCRVTVAMPPIEISDHDAMQIQEEVAMRKGYATSG